MNHTKKTYTAMLLLLGVSLIGTLGALYFGAQIFHASRTEPATTSIPNAQPQGNTLEEERPQEPARIENNEIRITTPIENELVTSPLMITGFARGSWLFEATAPFTLTDWDGRIIAEGYIEATEDWMTPEFVPIQGTLIFETPEDIGDFSDRGSIIFKNANPSGLPENDRALEYTIRFR